MTTLVVNRLSHSWLMLAGIGVFSLGMASGFLRSAEGVASDFTYTSIPHIAGRVAGASVSVAPGPVTVSITMPENSATYQWDLVEPVSIYNLLRIGERESGVTFTIERDARGGALLRELKSTTATESAPWVITRNGEALSDLNAPVILPGDTVVFSRR